MCLNTEKAPFTGRGRPCRIARNPNSYQRAFYQLFEMTVNKIMFGLFKFAKIIITSKVNVMDGTDERMPEKYNHFRIH